MEVLEDYLRVAFDRITKSRSQRTERREREELHRMLRVEHKPGDLILVRNSADETVLTKSLKSSTLEQWSLSRGPRVVTT